MIITGTQPRPQDKINQPGLRVTGRSLESLFSHELFNAKGSQIGFLVNSLQRTPATCTPDRIKAPQGRGRDVSGNQDSRWAKVAGIWRSRRWSREERAKSGGGKVKGRGCGACLGEVATSPGRRLRIRFTAADRVSQSGRTAGGCVCGLPEHAAAVQGAAYQTRNLLGGGGLAGWTTRAISGGGARCGTKTAYTFLLGHTMGGSGRPVTSRQSRLSDLKLARVAGQREP